MHRNALKSGLKELQQALSATFQPGSPLTQLLWHLAGDEGLSQLVAHARAVLQAPKGPMQPRDGLKATERPEFGLIFDPLEQNLMRT